VAGSASAVVGFFQFFCAAMTSLIVQPLAPSREARIAHVAAVRGMLDDLD